MVTSTCKFHENWLVEHRTSLTGINETTFKHLLYKHIIFWQYRITVYYVTEYIFHNANAAQKSCELVSSSI